MRNHGEVADPELGIVGYNYRMCELEASLALSQFKGIYGIINSRWERANLLSRQLKDRDVILPITKPNCTHAWYKYAVKGELGLPHGYVEPLYKLPVYKSNISLPVVEKINKQITLISMESDAKDFS
jgi:dTDP-4-amino-4,6-dideoxygalactose transaminase